MTTRDIVLAVRQRWWVLLLCVVVAGGAGAGIALAGPTEYSSTTRVVVAVPDIDQGSLQPPGGLSATQRATNYASLATSAVVLGGVIDELGLHLTPKELQHQIQVDSPTGTTVIQIKATDDTAEGAQQIAKSVAAHLSATAGSLEAAVGVSDPQVVISIADPAPLPTQPDSRGIALKGALGVIIGLILGAGILWVAEYLDSSVRDPEELATETSGAVLAAVPAGGAANLPMGAEQAAAFRTAGAALAGGARAEAGPAGAHIVVVAAVTGDADAVTSAARAAAQLAVTEARRDQRTLLIDGDLEHAAVSGLAGLSRGTAPGALQDPALVGKPAVTAWQAGGVDVLVAGAAPQSKDDVLLPGRVRALLDAVRADYDVIVISAPPALTGVDAATLTAEATGAVLVVQWGDTPLSQTRYARDKITLSGGRFAGSILSGVPGYRLRSDAGFVPAPQ